MSHLIIERFPGEAPPKLTPELLESVLSIKGHPGWEYLLDKLRYQRQVLRAHLESDPLESLEQVHDLRAGIRWTGWLEDQMNFLSATNAERTVFIPTPREEELFREISSSITMVGLGEK